ncbi:hypothetical protein BKA56DRAFT_675564 [Ilyonectria sp. MPI-CAGE-AT-0026]|nr:hypothetical protein BKA56DRAFT_675564 [Ilyonectria sp. MPI-CAGE-AT-0026]
MFSHDNVFTENSSSTKTIAAWPHRVGHMVEFVNPGWPQTTTGGPQSHLTIAGTRGTSNDEAVSTSFCQRNHNGFSNRLSTTLAANHHSLIFDSLKPNFGKWPLGDPSYQTWVNSSSPSLLLLHRIQGRGKTSSYCVAKRSSAASF